MIDRGEIAGLGEGVLSTTIAALVTARDAASLWVSNITLVNNDTENQTCNIYLERGGTRRRISPKDLILRPGYLVELNSGYSLPPGGKIEGSASAASVIEWTANGFERAL